MKIILFVFLLTSWSTIAAKKDLADIIRKEFKPIQEAFKIVDGKNVVMHLKSFSKKMKSEAKGLKSVYIENSPNTDFYLYPDGKVVLKGIVTWTIYPDGRLISLSKNGTRRIIETDERVIEILPDGTKSIIYPDGKFARQYPDGKRETELPDGTKSITYPGGQGVSKSPSGEKIITL